MPEAGKKFPAFFVFGEIVKEKPSKKTEDKKTEKHAGGRPPKYDPIYCKKIIQYFKVKPYHNVNITRVKDGKKIQTIEEVPNDLPLLEGFAASIGVHRDTVHGWTEKYSEFSDALKIAKDLQKTILVTNGLRGLYPAAAFIFTAKNVTDMRDKQVVEHEGLGAFVSKFNSPEEKI